MGCGDMLSVISYQLSVVSCQLSVVSCQSTLSALSVLKLDAGSGLKTTFFLKLNLREEGEGAGVVDDVDGDAGSVDEALFFLLAQYSLFDCFLIKGIA